MVVFRPVSTILVLGGALAVLAGLGAGGAQLYTLVSNSEYVLELPDNAADVQEFHWADGTRRDMEHLLKARIDEADFAQYAEALGMTPHSDDREYEDDPIWLDWSAPPHYDGDWWDPSSDLSATHVYQNRLFWEYAKYESGYVYVKAVEH
jgi:hypothetical protein